MIRKRLPLVVLIAAFAIVGYLALAAFADLSSVRRAAASLSGEIVLLVLFLSAVNYALRYARWRTLLFALGHEIPEGPNIAYYLAGFAFTATPGKAGEAVRSLYLLPHGVTVTESIGVLLFDRLFDLLAIGLLTLFLFIRWDLAAALAIAGCLAAGLAGLPTSRISIARILGWIPYMLPKRVSRKLSGLRHVTSRLAQPKLLILGMALGLLAWLAEGYGLYVLVSAMGRPFDLPAALGIYALSILIGVASFLPGGLGSTEAAMGLLLTRHGLSPQSAIAATILCRVATLWFAVVLGVLTALLLAIRKQPVARVPTL